MRLCFTSRKNGSVGTLSAGLAHELNNPPRRRRGASELNKALMKWQLLTHQMESMAFSENQMAWLEDFMKEASAGSSRAQT